MLIHQNTTPTRPARVLLLGAGGFLAPVVRELLTKDGVPVRAIGSGEIDLTSAGAAERLAPEIRRDDVIVMAAALTPDKGRDIGTLMKNLRMAESVCGALARTVPAHFVYISSDGVYDGRFSSLLNEQSTCEPADLYCLMHIAREKMLSQACATAKIPFTIVRPCAIFGPGDTHNSYGPNRFVRAARKDGKITLFGGGEEKRHHVYVGDVAAMVRLCILHRSTGLINAITGSAISFGQVAETIATAFGSGVKIERLPRNSPITHRHFDTSLVVRSFPDFRPTPLEEELVAMVKEVNAGTKES